ncbi:hypothetical protein LK09_00125 [Microbacterium mangrovi]|uniref:DUF3618 domain-containing protein n=1 Tax=Microbacterium mangrovi TaxID=1348253 RepID=A0A0B2ADT1_9MICO|nr:hypothetical protein [Microbacterium mangrovi]KHK99801.1 hypothetical protein LK09_00125 [Microbacterium mangrovi]
MTSDSLAPIPRTAVPDDITDPVERARAELKAALLAIEEKGNLPRRAAVAAENKVAQFRRLAGQSPAAAAAVVVGVAAVVGGTVWGFVSLYTRKR